MDYCNFDTQKKYLAFLNQLISYCDTVAIIEPDEDSAGSVFIEKMRPYISKTDWTRRFPGHGRTGNMKVLFFPLCQGVHSAFREYPSFLSVGYDAETEEGLDMAFYKNEDLVFLVISHEHMCDLSSKHELAFKETIEQYKIESGLPSCWR